MRVSELLLNLRLAIFYNKVELALRIVITLAKEKRPPLSSVSRLLARCLLEDKFPEGQRYFHALQEMNKQMSLKDRHYKVNACLLPAVYFISKLPTDCAHFQMAFMKMSGHDIANELMSETIESVIETDCKGDTIFLEKRHQSPGILQPWSSDAVSLSIWKCGNTKHIPKQGFKQLPQAYSKLNPITKKDFLKSALYGEEKVKGFRKQMSQYLAKYGEKHYYDEPVLMTMRRELRYEKIFPIRCEQEMIRRLNRVKDGWLVEWKAKKYKMTLPKRMEKKIVEKYKEVFRKSGLDERYEVNTPNEVMMKWKNTITFLYEVVDGEEVSEETLREKRGLGFDVMKTLVYRNVKGMQTYWRDLQIVGEKIYSVNEKTNTFPKTKDVWLRLIRNKKSVKIKKIVDELKEYLRSFGKLAFQDYMKRINQVKLYEEIMKTLETP